MEMEKLKWVENHSQEIIYMHQNRNNFDLIKKFKTEIKQVEDMTKSLRGEYTERCENVREYLKDNKEFNNHSYVISKFYPYYDRNNISYIHVYELKNYGIKIDIVSCLTGWCINFRTLENLSVYSAEDAMAKLLGKLKSNNMEIIEKPKNPYTDKFHITVYEKDSEIPFEEIANKFIEILKMFN